MEHGVATSVVAHPVQANVIRGLVGHLLELGFNGSVQTLPLFLGGQHGLALLGREVGIQTRAVGVNVPSVVPGNLPAVGPGVRQRAGRHKVSVEAALVAHPVRGHAVEQRLHGGLRELVATEEPPTLIDEGLAHSLLGQLVLALGVLHTRGGAVLGPGLLPCRIPVGQRVTPTKGRVELSHEAVGVPGEVHCHSLVAVGLVQGLPLGVGAQEVVVHPVGRAAQDDAGEVLLQELVSHAAHRVSRKDCSLRFEGRRSVEPFLEGQLQVVGIVLRVEGTLLGSARGEVVLEARRGLLGLVDLCGFLGSVFVSSL